MKVFNFGHPLAEQAKRKIDQYFGEEADYVRIPLNFDVLTDGTPSMEKQMFEHVKDMLSNFNGTERMVIVSPGMSNAAWALAAIIHGLSGRFPELVELRFTKQKVFDFYQVIDLEEFRQSMRELRD